MRVPTCHPDKRHGARGLCQNCTRAAKRRARGVIARPPVASFYDRFEMRLDRNAPGGCHTWTGATRRGQPMQTNGIPGEKSDTLLRRYVWQLAYGELPANRIFTLCGNRRCLNVKHLVAHDEVGRFWKWVNKSAGVKKKGCWEWTGSGHWRGYGQFQRADQTKSASHRFAYELTHGVVLADQAVIMHTCDNPPCCNPAHLKLGSLQENIADMIAKGRNSRGERHAAACRAARRRSSQAPGVARKEEP